MDNKIKETLLRVRPWAASPDDEQTLAQAAEADPGVKQLLQQQQQFNARIHDELGAMPVPSGLRDQILARRKIVPVDHWRKARPLLAIAASIIFLTVGLFYWLRPQEDLSVAGFRSRMVGFAVREYRMDLLTTNFSALNSYLASKGDPTQFPLPQKLATLPLKGGASLTWQGKPVSMICFDWGAADTLYMFVLGESLAKSPTTQIEALKHLNTATWSADGKTYVVAGRLPEQILADLVRS